MPVLVVQARWPGSLLDRHVPAEQFVGRQPDDAHSALAYYVLQAVPAGEEVSGLARVHQLALPGEADL